MLTTNWTVGNISLCGAMIAQIIVATYSYADSRSMINSHSRDIEKIQIEIVALQKDTALLSNKLATIEQKVTNVDDNVTFIRDNLIKEKARR